MKLSDIIDQLKTKSTQPQIEGEKKVNPEWEKCKDVVDSLPADYEAELRKFAQSVRKSRSGKLSRMALSRGTVNNHQLELIVYEPTGDSGSTKAFYALTNKQENMVYVRNLTD